MLKSIGSDMILRSLVPGSIIHDDSSSTQILLPAHVSTLMEGLEIDVLLSNGLEITVEQMTGEGSSPSIGTFHCPQVDCLEGEGAEGIRFIISNASHLISAIKGHKVQEWKALPSRDVDSTTFSLVLVVSPKELLTNSTHEEDSLTFANEGLSLNDERGAPHGSAERWAAFKEAAEFAASALAHVGSREETSLAGVSGATGTSSLRKRGRDESHNLLQTSSLVLRCGVPIIMPLSFVKFEGLDHEMIVYRGLSLQILMEEDGNVVEMPSVAVLYDHDQFHYSVQGTRVRHARP